MVVEGSSEQPISSMPTTKSESRGGSRKEASIVHHQHMTAADVAEAIGPLEDIRRGLEEFSRSARVFSEVDPRLIEDYPEQWVAVINGDVAAVAPTFKGVMAYLDEHGLPRAQAMVRFVSPTPRTMIL